MNVKKKLENKRATKINKHTKLLCLNQFKFEYVNMNVVCRLQTKYTKKILTAMTTNKKKTSEFSLCFPHYMNK